jgi:hypothetical protein
MSSVSHQLSDGPIPFGELFDLGYTDYREVACSKSTMSWLAGGAMTHVNGEPVTLRVMEEIPPGHNVIVKIWTQDA